MALDSHLIPEFFVWTAPDGTWWGLHRRPGGGLIHADDFGRLELGALAARIGYDMRLAGQAGREIPPPHRVAEQLRREERARRPGGGFPPPDGVYQ